MRLLAKYVYHEGQRHVWKHARKETAHRAGVSMLSRCINCGTEYAWHGEPDPCVYADVEYITTFDGENDPLVSQIAKDKAVKKCKRHMMKVFRWSAKNNREVPTNNAQGSTTVSSVAYMQLLNEGKISEIKGLVKVKNR